MGEFKGLPGIEHFLSGKGDGVPVEIPELDHIVQTVVSLTVLDKEQSERIVKLFFQEIRSAMLRGDVVDIRGFGSFFVSSPKTTETVSKVFPKFVPKKSLLKRMRNE